jgi:hypothetical protein
MTEADWLDWLACTEPEAMVRFAADRISRRKMILAAYACCLRLDPFFPAPEFRECLDWFEQYADDRTSRDELNAIIDRVIEAGVRLRTEARESEPDPAGRLRSVSLLLHPLYESIDGLLALVHSQCQWINWRFVAETWTSCSQGYLNESTDDLLSDLYDQVVAKESGRQAEVLRDVIGNPFIVASLDPAWLSWNDGVVRKLAEGIYANRAFDRMPILHDAMLDAGCTDESLLLHCRNPEGHVRGCWALDMILGKS